MSKSAKALAWIAAAPPGELRTQKKAGELFGVSQPSISAAMGRRSIPPIVLERAACAAIADQHGAHVVADLIRGRGSLCGKS